MTELENNFLKSTIASSLEQSLEIITNEDRQLILSFNKHRLTDIRNLLKLTDNAIDAIELIEELDKEPEPIPEHLLIEREYGGSDPTMLTDTTITHEAVYVDA